MNTRQKFTAGFGLLVAFAVGLAGPFTPEINAAGGFVIAFGVAAAYSPLVRPVFCANVLTGLIPDVYAALDVVSKELAGFIPSIARNSSADRLALGQSLRSPVTQVNTAGGDVTPAMALPARADQTILNVPFVLQKMRFYPFSWTGEEQKQADTGPGYLTIKQDQIAQAFRAAINEMEADCAAAARVGGSRAYGTAGTTPFSGTDLSDTAQLRKILDDNGAPAGGRTLVMDTTAGAKVRSLTHLTKANESGDTNLLRQGTMLDVHGFMFKESAAVQPVTAGTAAGYTTNTAGYAGQPVGAGATQITLITGTGTILAGDVVTFAGDTNKYVVASGIAAPGVITLAAPGLRKAIPAAATAVTVLGAHTTNVGLTQNAMLLGTRLPALPVEGDIAIDRETVTDDRFNLSFEIAAYPGYRMVTYQLLIGWGVTVEKPEHLAFLVG